MKTWMKRTRSALLMGLAWAVVWAVAAVLLSLVIDPDGSMDEMWAAIGAYPGFLSGVLFSALLARTERRRSIDEIPIRRVALWGGTAGLVMGLIPFAIGTPTSAVPLWLLMTGFAGTTTVLAAGSAAGTLALAQRGGNRQLRDAGPDVEGVLPHE